MKKIATYDGDFVLAADKKWLQLDVLTAASNITSASQGEKPSKTFLNSATLKYADVDEAVTGFCRMANSDDLVFVVRQRNGKFRVLGSEAFETNVNPSQDSGMAVTDASGTQLEVSTTDVCPRHTTPAGCSPRKAQSIVLPASSWWTKARRLKLKTHLVQ